MSRQRVAVTLAAVLVTACSRGSAPAPTPAPSAAAATPAADQPAPEADVELAAGADGETPAQIASVREPWSGDLDGMAKRGMLRVLVTYSKTNYFVDRGQQRGITYDALQEFEKHLNRKPSTTGKQTAPPKLRVVIVPVSRDELLSGVAKGLGDIAAANLTVTPEREKLVDFSAPFADTVSEIVVTGRKAPPLRSAEDLSGREVWVRASSSYAESLKALNERLRGAKRREAIVRAADEYLEDEDLLEMVNAGLIPAVVVDRHIAEFWSKVYSGLALHPEAKVRSGGRIAWALRKQSPKLRAEIDAFVRKNRQGTRFGNVVLQKYLKDAGWMRNPTAAAEAARFRSMAEYFRKYSAQYGFDYLMVAAQAYQESQLDQKKRSKAGAVGVMQVLPSTARDPAVGIPDVEQLESNIHAGVKYLRLIYDKNFADAKMSDLDKGLFCFAAYNAGPARINQLRRRAPALKLDPNRWFRNVELIAARAIGRETVQYVGNIYKYYVAYRLLVEQREKREQARAAHGAAAGKPPVVGGASPRPRKRS
jgi:membrane-bound lytic murein transglycosylase MltF